MQDWTLHADEYAAFVRDDAYLARHWEALHRGDGLPWPEERAVQRAWALFHAGRWGEAREAGHAAGPAGLAVACRAQALYATFIEPSERRKLELLLEVAQWARSRYGENAQDADAWYWQAHAMGRYAQAVQATAAVARELVVQIQTALERAVQLRPHHAEAHFGLGTLRAEVIDKLGTLIARSVGATTAAAIEMFERGLRLNPRAVFGRIEYAQGLLMLEGDDAVPRAEALFREAAGVPPLDAAERLGTEVAALALQE